MDERLRKRMNNLFELGVFLKDKQDSTRLEKIVERMGKINKQYENSFTNTYYNVLMAFLYSAGHKEDNSLTYYYRALESSINSNNKELIALAYNLIGIFYINREETERGIFYFKRALENLPNSAFIMGNIGSAYINKEKYKESVSYLKRSFIQFKTNNIEKKKMFNTAQNLAIAYRNLNKPEKAHKYLTFCEELLENEPENTNKSVLLEALGCYYYDIGNKEKALNNLLEALDVAERLEDERLKMRLCKQLSTFYSESENFKKAYKYQKLYHELVHAKSNEKFLQKISSIENKYSKKTRKIEQEKELLSKDNKEYQKKIDAIGDLFSKEIGLGKVGFYSDSMKKIVETTKRYHDERDVPILIEGETGTGKEIIARLIHYGDDVTSTGPFVVVNCSAISENLFESELFGYSQGAFTGAKKQGSIGKMELAQGGTLFLDEIGDLPLNLQPKLLRAIQHRSINRIGGKKEISLDIRIICATNRNLIDEIENGTFRRDLYHRIATGYINIPPLRKRKEEIEPLARLFLNEITQEKKKRKLGISQEAIELLQKYHWPGNVRELKSAIERVIIISDDLTILAKHFDFLTSINYAKTKENVQLKIEIGKMDLGKIEKKILLSTLDYFNNNKSLTAKSLGLSRATLYRKMRKNSF
jgi:transcriptional regulator with PAS, ATPase and Fis domain